MVANTDELLLEKSLQERLRDSQRTVTEAIRQRDQARLECQRLTLALRDFRECRDQTIAELVNKLRDAIHPEPFREGEILHVTIDATDWPNNWHFGTLFDAELDTDDGERMQVQFLLKEYRESTAVYEVCRLY